MLVCVFFALFCSCWLLLLVFVCVFCCCFSGGEAFVLFTDHTEAPIALFAISNLSEDQFCSNSKLYATCHLLRDHQSIQGCNWPLQTFKNNLFKKMN